MGVFKSQIGPLIIFEAISNSNTIQTILFNYTLIILNSYEKYNYSFIVNFYTNIL
jgi:hypothetical protein